MSQYTYVYYYGNIGIPGKGPTWTEIYNPNKTIGELINTMMSHNIGSNNKRIEIYKHAPGQFGKFDKNDSYWNHNTTLSEYRQIMSGSGKDTMLVYCII